MTCTEMILPDEALDIVRLTTEMIFVLGKLHEPFLPRKEEKLNYEY